MLNLYNSTTFTNVIPRHNLLPGQSLILFGKHSKVESVNTVVANKQWDQVTLSLLVCLYPPLCVWDIPVFSLCADLRLIDCQRITWLSHDKYERKKGLLMLLMYWAIEPKAPRQQSICDMVYSVSAKKPKNSVYFHFSFYEPSLALCQTVYFRFPS